ncbi:hypothetical protein EJB05_47777, partial [Eragrostis curvula]
MEPQHQLVSANKKRKSNGAASAAAACLCPAADLVAQPASSSARHALEQELLSRADLLQLPAAGGVVGDRRRERRMKNRASAERSRARRHAYVNELEAEMRVLRTENEQLKSLCDEVSSSRVASLAYAFLLKEAAEVDVPVKKKTAVPKLQRTSSSPF